MSQISSGPSTHQKYEPTPRYSICLIGIVVLAGLASQGLIFMRTWAISRKSRFVLIVLSVLFTLSLPMMIVGNIYKRARESSYAVVRF
jgi:hypothetical protein